MMILRRERPRAAAFCRFIAVVMSCASMFLMSTRARATEPLPISWRDDYGGAFEEARSTNRLVWIQFTGPWCPNCVRMERDSFPDADVIDHAQRSFVPLKLRSDVHEQLAMAFNLSGLPATVLVAPNREVIAVRQGYLGPDELDQLLDRGLATWRERETAVARAEKAKDAVAGENKDSDKTKSNNETKLAVTRSGPALAMAGFCPVSLVVDRKLVAGKAEHTVEHEGHAYRLASAQAADRFRKEPERFIPANRGECPVTQLDQGTAASGHPRWGVIYQGRLFLCSGDLARKQFVAEPARYAMADVAEQGFCVHCLGESGLLVRGDPEYTITRDGRRYWFPDPAHRDAFLAANPTAERQSSTDTVAVTTTVRR